MTYFLSSLTRIADLNQHPFDVRALDRSQWDNGDYVIGTVLDGGPLNSLIELPTGRMAPVTEGDLIVGAFGRRAATLEVVGGWEQIGDDKVFHVLSTAGLLGKMTSMSRLLPPLIALRYRGHAVRGGQKLTMQQFARQESSPLEIASPVVMLIGTSMSAGKTSAARAIIRLLAREGRRVVGAKLTGTGRFRDTLAMHDAGAHAVFDFVDAGLPSTVVPADQFRPALTNLLSRIARCRPDVLVAEIGASPLEPYGGDVAVDMLAHRIACTVLCASDAFAVVGVIQAFNRQPDLVAGVATSTEAGIALIDKLAGVEALNLLCPSSQTRLLEILHQRLDH